MLTVTARVSQVRLPAKDLDALRILAAADLFEVCELCLSDEESDGCGECACCPSSRCQQQ
jgi:hypothetical protein